TVIGAILTSLVVAREWERGTMEALLSTEITRTELLLCKLIPYGGMMMILPSSSDATALLTALKNMHARLLEHASLLWRPETTDAIR
ncbi:ABC transporter permease subunit, partial [Escherichia coli]|uniref:ABC transporter permease subunit n=1 Tax=Escherichia coli TaxID=562 RepID=UPI002076D623